MSPRTPPYIAPVTVTRRSVLQWLGGATVLALGAGFIRSCGGTFSDVPGVCDDGSMGPPFVPGVLDEKLAEEWTVRTIDPPELEAILAGWQLEVDGLVESPQVFSFADLMCLERQDQVTDLHCVDGWSVYDVPWNGVHLSQLFALCRPTSAATHVTFHTFGEIYQESLPLDVALEPRTLLGYGVGGATLPLDHGFPLRVVIPRLLGYKNAKYVQRIELDDKPVSGLWVSSGYPYSGEVPPARLRAGKY